MAPPKTRKSVPLPAAGEFLRAIDMARDLCVTLEGLRTSTARIPLNIRTQMRSMGSVARFWGENKALYALLAEAQQRRSPAAKRASAAGN